MLHVRPFGQRPTRRPTAAPAGPGGRFRCAWLLALIMAIGLPRGAGATEPLLTVAKNTLLGGVTGLILGSTLTLVVDDDQRDDSVRWGIVAGTFAGFGVGVWLAATGGEDLFAQTPEDPGAGALVWSRRDDPVLVARESFGQDAGAPAGSGWGLRWSLVSWRW